MGTDRELMKQRTYPQKQILKGLRCAFRRFFGPFWVGCQRAMIRPVLTPRITRLWKRPLPGPHRNLGIIAISYLPHYDDSMWTARGQEKSATRRSFVEDSVGPPCALSCASRTQTWGHPALSGNTGIRRAHATTVAPNCHCFVVLP